MEAGMEMNQMTLRIGLPSPPIPRFASSGDPFSSLARPLSSEEYFLLDHCMSTDTFMLFTGFIRYFGDVSPTYLTIKPTLLLA